MYVCMYVQACTYIHLNLYTYLNKEFIYHSSHLKISK